MLCEDDNLLSLCCRALLLIVCLSLNRPPREGRVDNALKENHGIINVQADGRQRINSPDHRTNEQQATPNHHVLHFTVRCFGFGVLAAVPPLSDRGHAAQ